MQKETMTVHVALCEVKTLTKRVESAIENIIPISTKECVSKKVDGMDIKAFEEMVKSGEQRALDLMARLNALKAALNQYNASAKVTICDKEYTIAEALWLMQYGMDHKKTLLGHYRNAYNKAYKKVEKKNGQELNTAAERAADVALGGKDKTNGDEYLDMVENYKKRHQYELVDPLGLANRIVELENEISKFESEVDAKIQSSNAITEITIEY